MGIGRWGNKLAEPKKLNMLTKIGARRKKLGTVG